MSPPGPRIAFEWIEVALAAPDRAEPDPHHPERLRSYTRIPALAGRILRVLHRRDGPDMIVISAISTEEPGHDEDEL
jgi:hypothetical protein